MNAAGTSGSGGSGGSALTGLGGSGSPSASAGGGGRAGSVASGGFGGSGRPSAGLGGAGALAGAGGNASAGSGGATSPAGAAGAAGASGAAGAAGSAGNPDSEAVTYSADVQPLLEESCSPCHSVLNFGGHNAAAAYADAVRVADDMLDEIESGGMPPACNGGDVGEPSCVSEADLELLEQWVDDDTPE